jgi:flagellar protein FlaG
MSIVTNSLSVSAAANQIPANARSTLANSLPASSANDARSDSVRQVQSADTPQAPIQPTPDNLKRIVGRMQIKVAAANPALQFSIDGASGKSIVKVTDQNTNEVIWQFPSEAALQISKEMDQFQKGLLLNRKA